MSASMWMPGGPLPLQFGQFSSLFPLGLPFPATTMCLPACLQGPPDMGGPHKPRAGDPALFGPVLRPTTHDTSCPVSMVFSTLL